MEKNLSEFLHNSHDFQFEGYIVWARHYKSNALLQICAERNFWVQCVYEIMSKWMQWFNVVLFLCFQCLEKNSANETKIVMGI